MCPTEHLRLNLSPNICGGCACLCCRMEQPISDLSQVMMVAGPRNQIKPLKDNAF